MSHSILPPNLEMTLETYTFRKRRDGMTRNSRVTTGAFGRHRSWMCTSTGLNWKQYVFLALQIFANNCHILMLQIRQPGCTCLQKSHGRHSLRETVWPGSPDVELVHTEAINSLQWAPSRKAQCWLWVKTQEQWQQLEKISVASDFHRTSSED